MLNDIMLSIIVLSVVDYPFILSAVMECHYAGCRTLSLYDERRNADWHYAECDGAFAMAIKKVLSGLRQPNGFLINIFLT